MILTKLGPSVCGWNECVAGSVVIIGLFSLVQVALSSKKKMKKRK